MYKANFVPVGIDQAPHVELTREITRRFNNLYKKNFPEPQTLLTDIPKVLGLDGQKMSKSLNNTFKFSDTKEEIKI
jgi:tryptophanyl-tRNA synthetase